MDTNEELKGQARKDGKLSCGHGEDCDCGKIASETQRSEAPAIPYGNPPEAGEEEPPESPPISAFA